MERSSFIMSIINGVSVTNYLIKVLFDVKEMPLIMRNKMNHLKSLRHIKLTSEDYQNRNNIWNIQLLLVMPFLILDVIIYHIPIRPIQIDS